MNEVRSKISLFLALTEIFRYVFLLRYVLTNLKTVTAFCICAFVYVGVRARVCVLEYFRWEFKAERVNELQGFASVFTMNSFILINVAKEIALLVSGG